MWVLRWRLNVCRVTQDLMSAGREFHVYGAATENARRASSVCTLGTVSSGASELHLELPVVWEYC